MRSPAEAIRDARESAGLSERQMADLLGVRPAELRSVERGSEDPTPALLDRCAQAFGLSLKRLMAGEARNAPMTMLLRALHESGRPTLNDLLATEAHRTLGEFVRCARDLAELRELLGEPRDSSLLDSLRPRAIEPESKPPHDAEKLARSVRELLGLGLEPIPSMIELVEGRLGVDVLWVTPEDLDRTIDGASTRCPGPAILVNLVGGAELWWRTRMTLAHELCHLIFDRSFFSGNRRRGFLVFSPDLRSGAPRSRGRPRWYYSDEFEAIEQRANAFAAYFLAPPEGVRELVAKMDPTSDEAIRAVSERYGVGRETAINVLTNTHRLPAETRLSMVLRPHPGPLPAEHPDRYSSTPGLRGGMLQDLALRALARGRLDRVQARDYLRLQLTEWLPAHEALEEASRAPLLTMEENVRRRAEAVLRSEHVEPSCYAADVTREADGWRVEIHEQQGRNAARRVGHIKLFPPTSGQRTRSRACSNAGVRSL